MNLCKIGLHKWVVKEWDLRTPNTLFSYEKFRICTRCRDIQVPLNNHGSDWSTASPVLKGHITERLMTVALLNNYVTNLELEMKEKGVDLDNEKQILEGIRDCIIRGESYIYGWDRIIQ